MIPWSSLQDNVVPKRSTFDSKSLKYDLAAIQEEMIELSWDLKSGEEFFLEAFSTQTENPGQKS